MQLRMGYIWAVPSLRKCSVETLPSIWRARRELGNTRKWKYKGRKGEIYPGNISPYMAQEIRYGNSELNIISLDMSLYVDYVVTLEILILYQ